MLRNDLRQKDDQWFRFLLRSEILVQKHKANDMNKVLENILRCLRFIRCSVDVSRVYSNLYFNI